MPVTVVATFHPSEGSRDDLLNVLLKHAPAVREEPGCLSYVPHTVGKAGLLMVESWSDGDALRAHGAGEALAALTAEAAPFTAAPVDVVVARPVEG